MSRTRRVLAPLFMTALLTAAWSSTVLAKCEPGSPEADNPACAAVVASLYPGGPFEAGEDTIAVITISQREEAVSGAYGSLVLSRVGGGPELRFPIEARSRIGTYTARVNLPEEGYWITQLDVRLKTGEAAFIAFGVQRVLDARPVAHSPTPGTPASTPFPLPPTLVAVAGLAALVAAALGLAWAQRRRQPRTT